MAWIISGGGLLIIAAVLGILVFIASQALPLFRPARSSARATVQVPAAPGAWLDEEGSALTLVEAASGFRTLTLPGGRSLDLPTSGPALPWQTFTPPTARGEVAVLGADNRLAYARFRWEKPNGEKDPARWTPDLTWNGETLVAPGLDRLFQARLIEGSGLGGVPEWRAVGLDAGGGLLHLSGMPDESGTPMAWKPLALPDNDRALAAVWGADGSHLLVGTRQGRLLLLEPENAEPLRAVHTFGEPITALGFALGQVSLLVGGERGSLGAFQVLRQDGRTRLDRLHTFQPMTGAVQGFMPSLRDKRFLAWSDRQVVVDHLTTERRLFQASVEGVRSGMLAARGDLLAVLDANGKLASWNLDAPHPEVSWKTLWGKVHYEGYAQPDHVWQSTGGSDDFEPKLSLVPLLFGTLKGTLFAMLFALPLAVFGALYTSQFASYRLKNTIKPAIEIMAALPSVVLGFIAGLVLAPLFEAAAIQVALLPFTCLAVGLILAPGWARLPRRFRAAWGEGREAVWLLPVLVMGLGLAMALGPWIETTFLRGDFRNWLYQAQGITYDQRNALVVGFAMGFAVIPIIFTISEDALSSVPKALSSASLACGASPWQTAWRVVLPTASPGIFSAIMVGFGRAIGETMIVLMATGNTPVMDWSPFNGMRTLAANIAVETPEAPVHGTLYRVLFLTALLLFALTFLLNTLAELIRQHLRKRYESF